MDNPDTLSIWEDNYEPLEEGAYIYGLYLEAARWNYSTKLLDESLPKVLYTQAPIIMLTPKPKKEAVDYKFYNCPMYKTLERWGILHTTGHSTNYIMSIKMNSEHDEDHWIKRGTALFTQCQ